MKKYKHPLFKTFVPTLTNEELEDFIFEYRTLEYTAHQIRCAKTARISSIALSIAFKEKRKRGI